MRASAETQTISVKIRPAPPVARLPRCTRCQSVGMPSTAEYWSIGETTTRFSSVMPRSRNGWNIGTAGLTTSTSKPCRAHVARHHLVDLGDELRRAQREIVVGDRLGARHQPEGEARRVHVPEAPHVLEPDQRHVGGVLGLLDLEAPLGLVMRQRPLHVASAGGLERFEQRDRVFHRELGAGADREMRGRLGVADQHDVVVRPAFAADGREVAPERAVDDQLVAGELLGEHAFEESRRLLPRRACRGRRARRSPGRSPSPRSSGPARTGSSAR